MISTMQFSSLYARMTPTIICSHSDARNYRFLGPDFEPQIHSSTPKSNHKWFNNQISRQSQSIQIYICSNPDFSSFWFRLMRVTWWVWLHEVSGVLGVQPRFDLFDHWRGRPRHGPCLRDNFAGSSRGWGRRRCHGTERHGTYGTGWDKRWYPLVN